jgi:hypothetical protein
MATDPVDSGNLARRFDVLRHTQARRHPAMFHPPRTLARWATVLALVVQAGALLIPTQALASCLPPDMQTWKTTPDTIVVAGSVVEVRPDGVVFDVQLWWGADPQRTIVVTAVPAAPADPTVITSVDWAPTVGEPWVVAGTMQDGVLVSPVCAQLPGTQATVDEARSSLGEPTQVPGVDLAGGPTQPTDTSSDELISSAPMIAIIVVLAVVAIIGGVIVYRRNRASA